jgi:hypothetical protein
MEGSMMEPKKHDQSGVSQTSGSVMNSAEGQQAFPQKPVGLTITVERIDRVLAGVQAQIEHLRRETTNLGLVREQLAGMETKGRGE